MDFISITSRVLLQRRKLKVQRRYQINLSYNDLLAHRIPRISWVHFARAIHATNYFGDFTVTKADR